MNVFFLVIGFFLLGLAIRFWLSPPQRLTDGLNLFAIHIAFPALTLTVVPSISVSFNILIPSLSFWCLVPVTWFLSKKISDYLHWSKEVACVCFIFLTFGNTAFLGIPMIKALMTDENVAYALLYDQFGIFIGLSTVAVITIARVEQSDVVLSFKTLTNKIFRFTPFPVLLISLLLPIQNLVEPLLPLLIFLGQLLVPAAMLVVGLQFSLNIERQYYLPMAIILLLKMIFLPALMWMLLVFLSIDPVMLSSIVFQVAAPPMITVAAMLISARIAVPLVGSTLGLGTIISFVLWPIWAFLLT